jgi:hypothetical protein
VSIVAFGLNGSAQAMLAVLPWIETLKPQVYLCVSTLLRMVHATMGIRAAGRRGSARTPTVAWTIEH